MCRKGTSSPCTKSLSPGLTKAAQGRGESQDSRASVLRLRHVNSASSDRYYRQHITVDESQDIKGSFRHTTLLLVRGPTTVVEVDPLNTFLCRRTGGVNCIV